MMATLDDKLLGEKLHYYCSSSESDGESEDEGGSGQAGKASALETKEPPPPVCIQEGASVNTGPKGVITDWQRFKQLEAEKREEQEKEKLALAKKLTLTCRSVLDEEKAKADEKKLDEDLDRLLNDDCLNQFMQKRMEDLLESRNKLPKFGKVVTLNSGQEYLDAVDQENKAVTVVIHIYEDSVKGCEAMNGCLHCLSQEYPQVKFCKVKATVAGVSHRFKMSGVPALLVYKGGQLIGNFVRLSDEFGGDFFAVDVENFLNEHGMLPDKTCVPQIVYQGKRGESAADSDDSGE